ncbi:hypothetical protein J437_LFUL010267 [Ladona fulva]|uniref:3-hydroxyisobutyryl-CoA hydrolase, mitochondrial n=1 Tax=Ladona fulva TaxID=123851 RepID=A0A8K0KC25_LADFU|nr:hypothetical protein J437_LFUL010267 [Ladona fulva]
MILSPKLNRHRHLSALSVLIFQLWEEVSNAKMVIQLMQKHSMSLIRSSLKVVALNGIRCLSSSTDEVIFQTKNKIGIVTLNRPKALNALNLSMIRKIHPLLKEWENEMSMVIIKGSGDKAFCAGGDVRAVTEAGKKGESLTKDFFREEYMLNSLIGTYHIPYVAFIHGITMGGGVGLSVHGQYRVATEKTLFAMPETAIGLFPDVGGSYFLPRMGGKLGLYLALTGHRLKGIDVLRAGVATHYVDSSRLQDLEKDLVQSKNPESEVPQILRKYTNEHDKGQPFSLQPHVEKINKYFSATSVEGIFQALEKDSSEWSQQTLKTLQKMSPTSMKVTLKQLEEGSTKNLQECLAMEYRLTQRFCADHDFYEGVRAVLVDKDNSPKWKPNKLEDVSSSKVSSFFENLPEKEELML